jgi:hypothetical protein
MKGGADMFVENMPGFPDNIRPSSSGGYWVAMSTIRPNPGFSMLDFLSEKPYIKRMIFKVIIKTIVPKSKIKTYLINDFCFCFYSLKSSSSTYDNNDYL